VSIIFMNIKFKFSLDFFLFALIGMLVGCGGGNSVSEVEVEVEVDFEIVDFTQYAGQKTKSASSWYVINASPPFGPRDHASLIRVGNRIHLSGGFYRGPSTYQDYWISDDYGVNWILIHGSALPLRNDLIYPVLYSNSNIPDAYARPSYFDSRYWLIDESTWYSNDGIIWVKNKNMKGAINGSEDLFIIIHKGVRHSIVPAHNLIWDTQIGSAESDYRLINNNFKDGSGAAVYSLGNYLYIAGGVRNRKFNNIIWRSLDGSNWKRVVNKIGENVQLPWLNIQWPCTVSDSLGRVWLIGGYDINSKKNVSDVWYTVDGLNWIKYEDRIDDSRFSALFPRHASACVFDNDNNRIIVIAGKGGLNPDNDTSFVTKDIIAIPVP